MSKKKYPLLILCGILCVLQILADESSAHLVRRKRVINLEPGEDAPVSSGVAPYVVNIKKPRGQDTFCVGNILSRHTVITIANCVHRFEASALKVFAGSSHSYRGIEHDVIAKNIHLGNHQRTNNDGIALLTVAPAFLFSSKINSIQLHQGILLPNMHATVFGWGSNPKSPRGTNYTLDLRRITVPIMNHRDCVNSYQGHMRISDNDICTYHPNRRCGHTDGGAPLVVDDRLAGLYLWREEIPGRISPDVFLVLQSLEYGPWIRNNIIHNVAETHRAE